MKKAVLFLFFLIVCSHARSQRVSDIAGTTLGGEEIRLSEEYAKGPVLVTFWALWCEPCKIEMKALDRLYKKLRDKGFSILAVNQDSPRSLAKVRSYIASQRIPFPVILDPNGQHFQEFNGQALPFSILLDSIGKAVYHRVGYLPGDEVELEEAIQKLLAPGQ